MYIYEEDSRQEHKRTSSNLDFGDPLLLNLLVETAPTPSGNKLLPVLVPLHLIARLVGDTLGGGETFPLGRWLRLGKGLLSWEKRRRRRERREGSGRSARRGKGEERSEEGLTSGKSVRSQVGFNVHAVEAEEARKMYEGYEKEQGHEESAHTYTRIYTHTHTFPLSDLSIGFRLLWPNPFDVINRSRQARPDKMQRQDSLVLFLIDGRSIVDGEKAGIEVGEGVLFVRYSFAAKRVRGKVECHASDGSFILPTNVAKEERTGRRNKEGKQELNLLLLGVSLELSRDVHDVCEAKGETSVDGYGVGDVCRERERGDVWLGEGQLDEGFEILETHARSPDQSKINSPFCFIFIYSYIDQQT